MMSSASFQLEIAGYTAEHLFVMGFDGFERASSPFNFRIELFPTDGEPLDAAQLLGQGGLLNIVLPSGEVRHVHGLVHDLEQLGLRGGRRVYLLRLTPAFERLKHVRRSRVFQAKTTQQIVQEILDEATIEHRWNLSGSYSPREYCVQYRESDFDFISRLLEWDGISYFFEHTDRSHVLMLVDAPSAYVPLGGGNTLAFHERSGRAANVEHVFALERVQRLRPTAVVLKDFDFANPALDLSASSNGTGPAALEVYEYPGAYVDSATGKHASKARLEERRVAESTFDGESACPRLLPGHTFTLKGHPEDSFNAEYVPLEVRHVGRRPQVHGQPEVLGDIYRNAFRCVPKDVLLRPPLRTPQPTVIGLQTATVVGPPGEEIHTDEHGRIKVQFHWDRLGQNDDRSSCWLRVGQPWGGPAWGAVTLPRIGQEVVIRFLEGSPDRPLAIGAVYNGSNPTPYELPAQKTRSTFQSRSSPGENGFNELCVEDAAGEEEVFLHAQKGEAIRVENDKAQEVGRTERLLVKKDRAQTIEGHQRLRVSLDDVSLVEGNRSLDVRGDRDTRVSSERSEVVEGHQSMTISKGRTLEVKQVAMSTIGAAQTLNIGAGYTVCVALAANVSVGGARAEEVAGLRSELVAGTRQEQVGENYTCQVGGNFQTEGKGGLRVTVGKELHHDIKNKMLSEAKESAAWLAKNFTLKADKLNVAVNGKLALSMERSGQIKLYGNTITLDGTGIKVAGQKISKDSSGSLTDLSAQREESDPLDNPNPGPVELSLKGPDGKAVANAAFECVLPDGSVKKGKTDGSGKAKIENAPAGKVTILFPELLATLRRS